MLDPGASVAMPLLKVFRHARRDWTRTALMSLLSGLLIRLLCRNPVPCSPDAAVSMASPTSQDAQFLRRRIQTPTRSAASAASGAAHLSGRRATVAAGPLNFKAHGQAQACAALASGLGAIAAPTVRAWPSRRASRGELDSRRQRTVATRVAALEAKEAGVEPCDLDSPSVLCRFDPADIDARFASEPFAVASRLADVFAAFVKVRLANDGGATLRAELSRLGPVFCKVGQTLATRPDIIGLETSRNLMELQDAIAPESSGAATAMATLAASLGGEYASKLTGISAQPVAAASLAEVYRATTVDDGRDVAVKIQRPGLERKIALDLYVMRQLLAFVQSQFQIASNVDIVVAVLDEVGAGIFAELDFNKEAEHMERFEQLYAKNMEELGVVIPKVRRDLTSTRVLVTEWINGVPPRDLAPMDRQSLAKTAVRCLAMQLMTDGFIHCDPHEGNLLSLPDGRVALLDFGLVAQMQTDHQEAMAHGVLNIMGENYEALEDIFKGMGVLDETKSDLRREGVEEPFAVAIKRCMTGGSMTANSSDALAPANAQPARKKLVQDGDGTNRRRAFGQLYEELSELAFQYYFTIPSYYILVMRSFVTLEGIALSADKDDSFNMYEATAPYARQKLLTPQTSGGRALLKAALGTPAGRRALLMGVQVSRPRKWLRKLVTGDENMRIRDYLFSK